MNEHDLDKIMLEQGYTDVIGGTATLKVIDQEIEAIKHRNYTEVLIYKKLFKDDMYRMRIYIPIKQFTNTNEK